MAVHRNTSLIASIGVSQIRSLRISKLNLLRV